VEYDHYKCLNGWQEGSGRRKRFVRCPHTKCDDCTRNIILPPSRR
jgi:hypothetical protein